jgi:hypothetical protein
VIAMRVGDDRPLYGVPGINMKAADRAKQAVVGYLNDCICHSDLRALYQA